MTKRYGQFMQMYNFAHSDIREKYGRMAPWQLQGIVDSSRSEEYSDELI